MASFKVGGAAQFFTAPSNKEEFLEAVRWANEKKLPIFMLGKGSNLVISDKGVKGLTIFTAQGFDSIYWDNNLARCDAGALVYTAMRQSVQQGLTGIQKLGGIPGTLGGAAYINAGAYGQEFSDVIVEVESCDKNGDVIVRTKPECRFSYRNSVFTQLEEYILSVKLELKQAADKEQLEKEMRESLAHRKQTQPLHLPNSGSIFKRPQGRFPGQIIEEAGLKGMREGGAEVSPKHANFIVNMGGASAQNIFDLSKLVQSRVKEKMDMDLEHEVRFIGEFLPWPR